MSLEVLGDDLDCNGNKIRGKHIHIRSTRDEFTIELCPGKNFVLMEGDNELASLTGSELAAALTGNGGASNGQREAPFELFEKTAEIAMNEYDLFAAWTDLTLHNIHIHTWDVNGRGAETFTLDLIVDGNIVESISDVNETGVLSWGEESLDVSVSKMEVVAIELRANPDGEGGSGDVHSDFPLGLVLTLTYSPS